MEQPKKKIKLLSVESRVGSTTRPKGSVLLRKPKPKMGSRSATKPTVSNSIQKRRNSGVNTNGSSKKIPNAAHLDLKNEFTSKLNKVNDHFSETISIPDNLLHTISVCIISNTHLLLDVSSLPQPFTASVSTSIAQVIR